MSQDPIPRVIDVLATWANSTIVDVTTNVVMHLVLNAFMLGQRFCCTERWSRACTNLTHKSQLNSWNGFWFANADDLIELHFYTRRVWQLWTCHAAWTSRLLRTLITNLKLIILLGLNSRHDGVLNKQHSHLLRYQLTFHSEKVSK